MVLLKHIRARFQLSQSHQNQSQPFLTKHFKSVQEVERHTYPIFDWKYIKLHGSDTDTDMAQRIDLTLEPT